MRKTPTKMVKPDSQPQLSSSSIVKGNTIVHELQFLQTFFEGNRIMPLDSNRIYSIIETETYNKLFATIPEYIQKTTLLNEELYKSSLQNSKLRTELEKLKNIVDQLKINERDMVAKMKDSFRDSRELSQIKNSQKAAQLNSMIEQAQGQVEKMVQSSKQIKQTASVSIQTEYNLHYNQIRVEEESSEIILSDDTEKNEEEEKLCRILEQGIVNFEEEFEKQMNQLNQQQLQLEKWEKENEQLKEENEELKKQIHQNKLEEQQLDIWRTNVVNLVSKLEGTIVKSNPIYLSHQETKDKNEEEIQSLKAQVIELRARIVEMKQKIKWVQEVMQGDEQIGDQGAVGVLVRLSQRMKLIVKNMMMEIERV